MFDWSIYFGFSVDELFGQALEGAAVVLPIIIFRVGYKVGGGVLWEFVRSLIRR